MELKEPKAKQFRFDDTQTCFPIPIRSETGIVCERSICTGTIEGRCVTVKNSAEVRILGEAGAWGRRVRASTFVRERQHAERLKWSTSRGELRDTLREMVRFGLVRGQHEVISVLSSDDDGEEVVNGDGATVVVLPDSDSDVDDYLRGARPRLCEAPTEERLTLALEEAFFLSYGLGCLRINALSVHDAWRTFCALHERFPVRYAVYHYFRAKGWIVKPGIKFGGDFLLYKKGPQYYHASYIVIIRCDHTAVEINHNWLSIQNFIRLSATSAKEILLADVAIPKDLTLEDLSQSPSVLKDITVCETLMRRWTPGQK